ncbi:MAG: hypothetical protein A3G24_00055 [Betaproteobacteria bacterium RIFCSPLOWO2_12_FULL_62_13]|nr:MAG: hypothetical protein A3G24_00055 [Betaproteobacteria bacterium RIFCSPLOWO2_12_FULL_62_13]
MNVTTWILAGGVSGWIGFSYLRFNAKRGLAISIIIGMAGGLLGGAWLAPLLGAVPVNPGDFNPLSLFTAFASAFGCLTVTDMIYKRFGV